MAGLYVCSKEEYVKQYRQYYLEIKATEVLAAGGMAVVAYHMEKGLAGCFQTVADDKAEMYVVGSGCIRLLPMGEPARDIRAGGVFCITGRSEGTLFEVPETVDFVCCTNNGRYPENTARTREMNRLLADLQEQDGDTRSHCERVRVLAMQMVRQLPDFPGEKLENLLQAARFHDVGKCRIPLEILIKPGRLTDAEYAIMKKHSEYSEELARPGFGEPVALILRQHHERVDGSGYPDGITGDKMDICAKIIGVADAYDAMVTSRPYHKGISSQAALDELHRCAGRQFDPACVEALCAALRTGRLEHAAEQDTILRVTGEHCGRHDHL